MFTKTKIISFIDLTSLNDNDDDKIIINLCKKAQNKMTNVAAICIYPQFITLAKKYLKNTNIKIATVVNFPLGQDNINSVINATKIAIQNGADEIDLVIDYQDYINNNSSEKSINMVESVKEICKNTTLKVIIESGCLISDYLIEKASLDAIKSGADFIKTSTGKVNVGATLSSAEIMLNAIKLSGKKVGFKASGGVKNYQQSCEYLQLATEICGADFINNISFRFGVSSLLDNLLDKNTDSNGY